MGSRREQGSRSDDIALALGVVIMAAGAASLIAWGVSADGRGGQPSDLMMLRAEAALGFVLAGAAVILATRRARARAPHWLRPFPAAVLASLAVLILVKQAAGLDLRFARLVEADGAPASGGVGGISPATAAGFFLLAVTLLLPPGRLGRAFGALTVLGLAASFLSLVGHLYEAPQLYRPGGRAAVTLAAALCFTLAFGAVALTRPEEGWVGLLGNTGAGSITVRRLVPAIVLVPPLLGGLVMRGEQWGVLNTRMGSALLAVGTVAALTVLLWHGVARGNRLHETLQERERLSRAILDSAFDAFVLMDEEGIVRAWNAQAERIFGWPSEEALGRPVADLVVPEAVRAAHRDGLARFRATGESRILRRATEVAARRRDGSEFPAELIVVPFRHEGRWVFSGFIRDLTERKEAERQLRQAQKMQAIGQLTGGIAHDFNNLLTVIIGGLDALGERLSGEDRARAEFVLRAAERGAALTHRLLAFARRQPLRREPVDPNEIVQDMQDLLRRTLGEPVALHLRLEPGIGRAFADKAELENALLNLAINARDAMPEGGRLVLSTGEATLDEAYVAANPDAAPGDYIVFTVSDSGVGMSREVAERAFEPFFSTKEPGKGTGLGLSTVYGFVKQCGGHVKIYSELGVGTTVRLYLPRAAAADQPRPEEEAEAAVEGRGQTILVVEDHPEVRRATLSLIQGLGYRTIEAEDGRSALAVIEGGTPVDLLFSDVVMAGGMSGIQLAEAARRLRPGLRVLFTSGFAEAAQGGGQISEADIVRKPYRRKDLARRLAEALNRAPAPAAEAAGPAGATGPA